MALEIAFAALHCTHPTSRHEFPPTPPQPEGVAYNASAGSMCRIFPENVRVLPTNGPYELSGVHEPPRLWKLGAPASSLSKICIYHRKETAQRGAAPGGRATVRFVSIRLRLGWSPCSCCGRDRACSPMCSSHRICGAGSGRPGRRPRGRDCHTGPTRRDWRCLYFRFRYISAVPCPPP